MRRCFRRKIARADVRRRREDADIVVVRGIRAPHESIARGRREPFFFSQTRLLDFERVRARIPRY